MTCNVKNCYSPADYVTVYRNGSATGRCRHHAEKDRERLQEREYPIAKVYPKVGD